MQVVHFPFPTSPEAEALKAAQTCLVALSALHPPSSPTTPLGLTPLGRAMSAYPITPRPAKMLLQVNTGCYSVSMFLKLLFCLADSACLCCAACTSLFNQSLRYMYRSKTSK